MKVNGAPLSSGEGKRSAAASGPDPEVSAKATRRRFTAGYKLSFVEKADACESPGEIGELLRREGLYGSHLSAWRKAARAGEPVGQFLQGLLKRSGPPCHDGLLLRSPGRSVAIQPHLVVLYLPV